MRTTAYRGSPGCPAHPKTQLDFDGCAARRGLTLDARFNGVVGRVWPLLDTAERSKFMHGQAAWRKYVEDECGVAALQFRGGSIAPLVVIDCRNRLTRARVRDVAAMLTSYTQG